METLNVSRGRTYLVKFAWTILDGKFITTDLAKCIKDNQPTASGRGIEYIKEFDTTKNKFVRISKSDILRFHKWDTESYEILINNPYFK